MQLKSLRLSQVRGFEEAEFEFKPGMNLIVGINGAGKSTVLDVLRIMLSQVLPKLTASKSARISFEDDDIKFESSSLTAELQFDAVGIQFSYLVHKSLEEYGSGYRPATGEDRFAQHLNRRERIRLRREQVTGYDTFDRYELKPNEKELPKGLKTNTKQPLVVYFSPRRSVAIGEGPSKAATAGGQAAAFSEAFSDRQLRWREIAEWWRVQEELGKEQPEKLSHIEILRNTAILFLDNCKNLRVEYIEPLEKFDSNLQPIQKKSEIYMVIDKNGDSLDVRQLSDGERGILSLVLDLARRLTLANPGLSDPIKDGEAVVLIDELDLHLHPGWQREVVEKLSTTFPKCQFIATTHSPQIVGEVSAENIHILEAGKAPYRPDQSLGMDTNWILAFLMGANTRNPEIEQALNKISDLIEDGEYEQAQSEINILRENNMSRDPELLKLQTRLDRFQILNDSDPEK